MELQRIAFDALCATLRGEPNSARGSRSRILESVCPASYVQTGQISGLLPWSRRPSRAVLSRFEGLAYEIVEYRAILAILTMLECRRHRTYFILE